MAASGRPDEAVALASQAVALAADTVDIELHADALVDLADVLQLAGRKHEEGPPLREALDLYDRKGDVVLAAAVRERLGATQSAERV